ncbi:beta-1,3-galactosyltransferase 5-like [Physella acuta]|uniref:beta-1,3-galactosyltransferase 5-like n=1 Tax=Physella acuta TaxID=109671 RepID=UPI0027DDCA90|nr:beta-1,3-galactosyltransferase 5-like [Physella acuta]
MRVSSFNSHLSRHLKVTLALLALACCGFYLMVHSGSQPKFVIKVETDPSIYELTRLVQEQREKIEYMAAHPKVIFRCLDDEPKIKYPRHASDDLTKIVLDTSDECGNMTELDAVVIVHTSADHFTRRERFRRAYANYSNTSPYRLKVVFLIGQVLNAEVQIKVEMENRDYGDTVVGNFLDSYQNLTLKAVMGFRWLANMCNDVKLLIKMDDDVFFDVRKFFTRYWNKLGPSQKTKSIHCQVWENAVVGRTGKWKVERGLWANSSYPFPYCAGFFVVVTPDLIRPMYEVGKSIDFFWIDDVFLYGMVPSTIKGIHFNQIGRKKRLISQTYKEFPACNNRKGRDYCTLWAVLTNGADEFALEYAKLHEPPALKADVTVKPQPVESLIVSGSLNDTGSLKDTGRIIR